jgi:hypothetical protein
MGSLIQLYSADISLVSNHLLTDVHPKQSLPSDMSFKLSPDLTFARSPPASVSSRASSSSYFPFSSDVEVDEYAVPPLKPPAKPKGQYCYYTKKKDEAEVAHQEEGIRMIMLMLHNWLGKSSSKNPRQR